MRNGGICPLVRNHITRCVQLFASRADCCVSQIRVGWGPERRVWRRKTSCSCRKSNHGFSAVQPAAQSVHRLCAGRSASLRCIKGEQFLDQGACQIVNKIIELRHSDVSFCYYGNNSSLLCAQATQVHGCTQPTGRAKYVLSPDVPLTVTTFYTIGHEIPASWHHEYCLLRVR